MIEYDDIEQRMVLKLVYYGPALSGKTTNLRQLHEQLHSAGRGDLMVLDTMDDRTIYFDLLPFFLVAPSGLRIKVKVFTVPGQARHDATRKAVLRCADGVAFIADSQLAEDRGNVSSFANLKTNLACAGLDIEQLPLVIQFNKRDLPGILSAAEIQRTWGSRGFPIIMASAGRGAGVMETFTRLLELTYDSLDKRFHLASVHGLRREEFTSRLVNCHPGERFDREDG